MNDKDTKVGGRKVINDYDWSMLEDKAAEERDGKFSNESDEKQQPIKRKRVKKKKNSNIKERHQQSQKEKRLFEARIRACVVLVAAIIIVMAILLLTPLFDIKNISISGNKIVTAEQFSETIGYVKGKNLISTGKGGIKSKLKAIKYVNDVEVKKTLIPPTIDITISEYIPAAYIQVGAKFVIIDKNLYVIEDAGSSALDGIPCVTGVEVKNATAGSTMTAADKEKLDNVKTFLKEMEAKDEIQKVTNVDFSDMNNITFNYDNRITANCGSSIELDRKLRLFIETVNNENLNADAKGTIDLSTVGNAIYTP